jgi:splicing factor 3A subunit 1
MSALNLPKPVNTYAGEDALRNQNGGPSTAPANGDGNSNGNGNGTTANANANGDGQEDIGEYRAPRMSDKFKVGMIYPPKEMRSE